MHHSQRVEDNYVASRTSSALSQLFPAVLDGGCTPVKLRSENEIKIHKKKFSVLRNVIQRVKLYKK